MIEIKKLPEIVKENGVYMVEFHGCNLWALNFHTPRARKFKFVGWIKSEVEPSPERIQKAIDAHVDSINNPFKPIPGVVYRLT